MTHGVERKNEEKIEASQFFLFLGANSQQMFAGVRRMEFFCQ